MSIALTGSSATAAPPVDRFAQLSRADRRGLPNGLVDAYPLAEAQADALARVLTAPAPATGNLIAVRRQVLGRPFALHDLRRALHALTAAHDTLRTSFAVERHRVPLQLVHAEAEIPLSVHDLRALDEPRRAAVFGAHEVVEREVPLPTAPPLRLAAQLETDTALRLVLTYSPALLDAGSAERLLGELAAVYEKEAYEKEAFGSGGVAPAVPYAAYVAAERAALDDPAPRAHWRRVADTCAPLLLPEGWGTPDHRGRRHTVRVPFGDLSEELRTLGDRAGTPLGAVLLAAHLRALGSLTPDAAFHTAVRNDGRPEQSGTGTASAAGLPVLSDTAFTTTGIPNRSGAVALAPLALGSYRNTVPFPHRQATGTWRELVAATERRASDTEPYRHYPWAAVRRAARTPGRLADVLFDPDPAAGPDHDGTEFPLVVRVFKDALVLDAAYDALDETHAELLAGIYREVLVAMADDPDGDAAMSRMPGPLARNVLAAGGPHRAGHCEPLVPELIAVRAAESPDAVAVIAGETTLDYRTLGAHANRIAHRLRGLGAGRGDLVGVLLNRGPALLPALLGVLRSGAAYVPLDPSVPDERLAHILSVTDAPLILTESALTSRIPAVYAERAVVLDSTAELGAVERQPSDAPAAHHGPDDLAYVIFTSGSTGTPKGVMLPHGALAQLLHSFAEPEYTGDWLAATSVSFDISGLELYLPLITGGRVVLADDTQAKDPAALLRLVDEHRVTHVQATPSGWRLLLAVGFDRPTVTALAGGEELPARLAGELRSRVKALTNVYGPTETAIWSASWQVGPQVTAQAQAGATAGMALGQPLNGESLHVLDQALEPVVPGVAGELCIGGSGLARGYHGRPALTADRFVPDPHGTPGARLYRTGDLARRYADGTVEFLGRIDTQVKISGHRIELGEVRAVLTEHPAIRDAVIVVRESSPGTKRLIAYVVAAGRTDVSALRRHLAAKLPGYMIPAAFVAIPRVPLSVSGKVDLGALPAPGAEQGAARRPSNPTEARVAALCAEVLGLRGLGPDDNVSQHGARSLSVVRMLMRIRREFAIDLPVSALFERLTISGLAAAVLAADRAVPGPDTDTRTGPPFDDGCTAAREYKA